METKNKLPFTPKSAVFKRLAEITDIASLSKQERMMYDESLRKFRDTIGVMEGARLSGIEIGMKKGREEGIKKGIEKGIKKGRAEGKAEGKAKERLRVACELKRIGTPMNTIIKVTGLAREDIEKL